MILCNIKKGDEVIIPSFTFTSPANCLLLRGAKPIFVDVRDDFNIDPNKIEEKNSSRTKAIVPMHVAGHMCDMASIQKIAIDHKLVIVEDAAQVLGAAAAVGRELYPRLLQRDEVRDGHLLLRQVRLRLPVLVPLHERVDWNTAPSV